MNFQDPFSGDLTGFRFDPNAPASAVASAPSAAAPASRPAAAMGDDFWGTPQPFTFGAGAGSMGGGRTGRPQPVAAAPTVNVNTAPSRLAPADMRAPLMRSGVGGAGGAGGAPAVAGRRADPASAAPVVTALPPPAAATSALDWLDEVPAVAPRAPGQAAPPPQNSQRMGFPASAPPTAAEQEDPLSFLDPDAGQRGPVRVAGPATAGPVATTAEDDLVARAQAARWEASQKAQAAKAAAEAAKAAKEAELRDLYASLDALDMEMDLLHSRLDTQTIKEETELTELETALLLKQQELQTQQAEMAAKVEDAHQYGERQTSAMQARFAKDCAAMREEVQTLEGGRQRRQLAQLEESLRTEENTLRQLRRQRDLIAQSHPFGADGVRIAVAMAAAEPPEAQDLEEAESHDDDAAEAEEKAATSTTELLRSPDEATAAPVAPAPPAPTAAAAAGFDDFFDEFPELAPAAPVAAPSPAEPSATADAAERVRTATADDAVSDREGREGHSLPARLPPAPTHALLHDAQQRLLRDPTVEEAMTAAVELLQRYLHTHLSVVKDEVVDCVHAETLATAHTARLAKMAAWGDDVAARKTQLSQHVLATMAAARDRARDRDVHSAAQLKDLHAILQQGRDAVRALSKQRLEALQTELTARLAYTTKAFATEAEHTWKLVEKELRCTLEGDAAMAAAQSDELAQRLGVDRRVRGQLYRTQRDDLDEQLGLLRRQGEARYQARVQNLLESTGALSGRHAVGELRDRLVDMRGLVGQQRQKLTDELQRRADGREALLDEVAASSPAAPSCAENRMHLQELRHQLRTLQHVAAESFEKSHAMQKAAASTRAQLMAQLKDGVVAALRERRSAQQSHSTQIEFVRRLWEREHRQCLQAGHALEVRLGRTRGGDGASDMTTTAMTASSASIVSETRVHPQEVTLTWLLEALCETLTTCTTRSAAHREARLSRLADMTDRLDHLHAHHGDVQLLWAALYERMLRLHDEQKSLSSQTVAVTEETVRLANETHTIDAAAQEMERRRAVCRQEGAEMRETYTATLAEYEHRRRELDKLADRQLALAQEQNLLQLQGTTGRSSSPASLRVQKKKRAEAQQDLSTSRTTGDSSEEEGGLSPEQKPPRRQPRRDDAQTPSSARARAATTRVDRSLAEPEDGVCAASPTSPNHASAEVSPIVVHRSPHTLPWRTSGEDADEDGTTRVAAAVSPPPLRPRATPASTQPTRASPVSTPATTADTITLTQTQTQTHRTPPRTARRQEAPAPSSGMDTSGATDASGAQHETSGVSATSLYRTSFMDLLSVVDSTTSF